MLEAALRECDGVFVDKLSVGGVALPAGIFAILVVLAGVDAVAAVAIRPALRDAVAHDGFDI